mmetsp:Transcript_222/g.289  ORF Transcript_222/g.289 Transcript_222/m.289 type:complete len:276 (+) Transcript_222:504-1331(+)
MSRESLGIRLVGQQKPLPFLAHVFSQKRKIGLDFSKDQCHLLWRAHLDDILHDVVAIGAQQKSRNHLLCSELLDNFSAHRLFRRTNNHLDDVACKLLPGQPRVVPFQSLVQLVIAKGVETSADIEEGRVGRDCFGVFKNVLQQVIAVLIIDILESHTHHSGNKFDQHIRGGQSHTLLDHTQPVSVQPKGGNIGKSHTTNRPIQLKRENPQNGVDDMRAVGILNQLQQLFWLGLRLRWNCQSIDDSNSLVIARGNVDQGLDHSRPLTIACNFDHEI